jgi:class 3 adenylate cyclase
MGSDIMNCLVRDFDDMVMGRNLTKIDTIGDAYIVVGWLSEAGDNDSTKEENNLRCLDMLILADGILSAVSEHRDRTGVDLHARIGISTGDVICGVMGVLQPRFSLYGQAMNNAATLEEKGPKDVVHCSPDFHESCHACMLSNTADQQHNLLLHTPRPRSFNRAGRRLSLKIDAVATNIVRSMMDQGKLVVQRSYGGWV